MFQNVGIWQNFRNLSCPILALFSEIWKSFFDFKWIHTLCGSISIYQRCFWFNFWPQNPCFFDPSFEKSLRRHFSMLKSGPISDFFKILNGRICWHKSSLILNDLWKLWHQQKSNLEQDLNKNLHAVIFIFFDWTGIPTFSMQKSAEPRGGCVIRKTTVSP